MNPTILNQVRPLAMALPIFALTIFVVNASILGGQPDIDDLKFEPPKVVTSATRPTNNLLPTQKPLPKVPATGKANVVPNSVPSVVQGAAKPRQFPGPTADPRQLANSRATAAAAAVAKPSPILPASANSNGSPDSAVKTAGHYDPLQVVTPDGGDATLLHQRKRRIANGPALMAIPGDRGIAPGVSGSILNLKGEPASVRLIQMQSTAMELERENEELRQQNSNLMSRVKESHDQLVAGVREIQLARKELTAARSDLDKLRNDLQSLRDKVRIAEREYSAVLQSMGPLLQQLLETDEVSALPPNPSE